MKQRILTLVIILGAIVFTTRKKVLLAVLEFILQIIDKLDTMEFVVFLIIIICTALICLSLVAAIILDIIHHKSIDLGGSFEQRHPNLYLVIGLSVLAFLASLGCGAIYLLGSNLVHVITTWVEKISKLDAVVIVALITGAVSITGVIISSLISKVLDYRQTRRTYLTQKREDPYGKFVDMIYKIQQNAKVEGSYSNEEMLSDMAKFSKQITLWGSPKVVSKWVAFRNNSTEASAGTDTLFILEDIMNEMRRDLGLKKVKKGNLLAFFINDIKKILN